MPDGTFGILACVSAAMLLMQCEEHSTAASSRGPDTGLFGISGSVSLPDHKPARGAAVRIRKAGFMGSLIHLTATPIAWNTDTDSAGGYRFVGLAAGAYAVEVNLGDTLGLFQRVSPGPEKETPLEGVLAAMGTAKGFLVMPDSATEFNIQAYGMDRAARVKPNGAFSLSLPAGEYVLQLHCESSRYSTMDLPDIRIAVGQDTLLPEINSADLISTGR